MDRPASVLTPPHEGTDIPGERLRQITVAGWLPRLLDTLDAAGDPSASTLSTRTNPPHACARRGPPSRSGSPAHEPTQRSAKMAP